MFPDSSNRASHDPKVLGYSNGKAVLQNAVTGAEIRTFRGLPDRPTAAAISPGRRILVLGFPDRQIRTWDMRTGQQLVGRRLP